MLLGAAPASAPPGGKERRDNAIRIRWLSKVATQPPSSTLSMSTSNDSRSKVTESFGALTLDGGRIEDVPFTNIIKLSSRDKSTKDQKSPYQLSDERGDPSFSTYTGNWLNMTSSEACQKSDSAIGESPIHLTQVEEQVEEQPQAESSMEKLAGEDLNAPTEEENSHLQTDAVAF